jgi:hypothetical protein
MSATDTAKEVIRIASTAGLSKDVIDLMDKKLALLTSENAELKTKVSAFEIEVRQLRSQLAYSQPVGGGLVENMGVFWKRTTKGFEPNPYCSECSHHPVMRVVIEDWVCSQGHSAPHNVHPPVAS